MELIGKERNEGHEQQIRQAVSRAEPTLRTDARRCPKGIQYDVEAPEIVVSSPEEYEKVMKTEDRAEAIDDLGLSLLSIGVPLCLRPKLGLLNIIDFGTPDERYTFHSVSGGSDFEVRTGGKSVTIEGVSPEVASQSLAMLLGTLPYREGVERGFHLSCTYRNLEFFNHDGTLREDHPSARRVPLSDS